MPKQPLTFFIPKPPDNSFGAIYFDTGISAGFPSPADDFKQERLSLDSELIKNKEATFFARVSGQSMKDAGLNDNDLFVEENYTKLKFQNSGKISERPFRAEEFTCRYENQSGAIFRLGRIHGQSCKSR